MSPTTSLLADVISRSYCSGQRHQLMRTTKVPSLIYFDSTSGLAIHHEYDTLNWNRAADSAAVHTRKRPQVTVCCSYQNSTASILAAYAYPHHPISVMVAAVPWNWPAPSPWLLQDLYHGHRADWAACLSGWSSLSRPISVIISELPATSQTDAYKFPPVEWSCPSLL